jgi:Lrp/AsnC family transcriptional regulator, leucine-responsive regulatory protein
MFRPPAGLNGTIVPNLSLDAIDIRILRALQANARVTNVELAAAVGLSPSPCLRRWKRLEDEGLIAGYRTVLDRKAAGLGLTVFLEIRVAHHSRDNAAELEVALVRLENVISAHMISGAADFLVEVAAADLEAYERFLTEKVLTLPMIQDVRSNFSLRRIKSEGALPVSSGRD